MNVKSTLSGEEITLFRDAIGQVKRLRTDKIVHQPEPRAPRAYQTRLDELRVMQELLDADLEQYDLQPGDDLSFCRAGVRKTVMRKLRRGQYRIAAELDLHGFGATAAKHALLEFIREAKVANARCVRVIHGKGRRSSNHGPVIKPLVGQLLRRSQDVLAFCSARPVDGGTGALYVLLKGA
jgi:DNA-nicking Smr family endonuclease